MNVLSIIQVFYQTVTPVICIALIGYLFGSKLEISPKSLNRITYYFFVPAFVFYIFASSKSVNEKIISVLPAVFALQLAITFVAYLTAKIFRKDSETTSAYVICTAFPNIGNFALPLLIFRFGDSILEDAALLFLVVLMHAFAISVFFAGHSTGLIKRIWTVLKTPAILAFFAALIFVNFSIEMPVPLARITKLMGDAMFPVMLFTIGAQLALIPKISFDADVLIITLLKLIIAPLIAFLVLPYFNLDDSLHKTAIIDFSMPTALLANIIATENNTKPNTVTMAVFFSTLGSVVTLTLLLTFF